MYKSIVSSRLIPIDSFQSIICNRSFPMIMKCREYRLFKNRSNIDIFSTRNHSKSIISIRYRALYNYRPQNEDELELREGDTVYVMEKCDDGWFVGSSQRTGYFGTFPGNYVERLWGEAMSHGTSQNDRNPRQRQHENVAILLPKDESRSIEYRC